MNDDYTSQAAAIVVASLANPSMEFDGRDDIVKTIEAVYGAVAKAHGKANTDVAEPPPPPLVPAVPIEESIHPDYLVCLEDGKKLKMLKRYLRTQFGLSADEYRRRWRLPGDYPMAAPGYSQRRSQMARDQGLGRTTAPAKAAKATKRARR